VLEYLLISDLHCCATSLTSDMAIGPMLTMCSNSLARKMIIYLCRIAVIDCDMVVMTGGGTCKCMGAAAAATATP
jgi:hypothetical protein